MAEAQKERERQPTQDEVQRSEQILKAFVPGPHRDEQHDLADATDRAIETAQKAVAVGREIDQRFGLNDRQESNRLRDRMGDLDQLLDGIGQAELGGIEKRYSDSVSRIKGTLTEAGSSLSEGDLDQARNLFTSAQGRMERLSSVMRDARNLAAAGAPEELISALDKSVDFIGTQHDERAKLIDEAARAFLERRDAFTSEQGRHIMVDLRGFAVRVGDISRDIDIAQERENLSQMRKSADTVDSERRGQVLTALEIQKAILQQMAMSAMKGQASDLQGAIESMIGKLKDKKKASEVKQDQVARLATMILSFKSMISALEEIEDKQLRDDAATIYSAALKLLSSGGSYTHFKLLILAVSQIRARPDNLAYRKEILARVLELANARTPAQKAETEKKLIDLIIRGLSGELEKPKQKDHDVRKIFNNYLQTLLDKFIKKRSDERTSIVHDACNLFFFFREKGKEKDASLAKELILGAAKLSPDVSRLQLAIITMLGEIELKGYSKELQEQILDYMRSAFAFAKTDIERATLLARAGSLVASYAMLSGKAKGEADREYKDLSALLRGLMKGMPIPKEAFDIIDFASRAFIRGHQHDTIDKVRESLEESSGINSSQRAFMEQALSKGKKLADQGQSERVDELLRHIGFLQVVIVKKCPFGIQELKEMITILSADRLGPSGEARFRALHDQVSPKINNYLSIQSEAEELDAKISVAETEFSKAAKSLNTPVEKLLDLRALKEKRADLLGAMQTADFERADILLAEAGEIFASQLELAARKAELLSELAIVSGNAENMQGAMAEYGQSLRTTGNDLRRRGLREKSEAGKGVKKYSGATGTDMEWAGNLLGHVANDLDKKKLDLSRLAGIRGMIESGNLDDATKLLEQYENTEFKKIEDNYSAFLKQKSAIEFLVGELYSAEQLTIAYAGHDADLEKWPAQTYAALWHVRAGEYDKAKAAFEKGLPALRKFLNARATNRPGDVGAIILSKQKRFEYSANLLHKAEAHESGFPEANSILSAYETMAMNSLVSENRVDETLKTTTGGIHSVVGMADELRGSIGNKDVQKISLSVFSELVRTVSLQESALSAEDKANNSALVWAGAALKTSRDISKALSKEDVAGADFWFQFLLYQQTRAVQLLSMEENRNHPLFAEIGNQSMWLGEKRFELLKLENAFKTLVIKDHDTKWYAENTLQSINKNFDEISRMASLIVSRFWVSGEADLQRKIFDLSKVVIDLRIRQLGSLLERCRKGEAYPEAQWQKLTNDFLHNELGKVKDEGIRSAIRTGIDRFGAFSLDMALIRHIGEAEIKEIYGKMGRDVTDIIGSIIPGYGTIVSLARTGRADAVTVGFDILGLIPMAGSLAKGARALSAGAKTFRAAGAGARTLQRLGKGYRAYTAARAIGMGEALGLSGKTAKVLNYLETGSAIAGVGAGISYSGYALASQGFTYETALGALQASLAPMAWGGYALAARRPPGTPPHWLFKERNPFMWMDARVQGLRVRANAELIRSARANGYKGDELDFLDNIRLIRGELSKSGKSEAESIQTAEKELVAAGGDIAKVREKLGLSAPAQVTAPKTLDRIIAALDMPRLESERMLFADDGRTVVLHSDRIYIRDSDGIWKDRDGKALADPELGDAVKAHRECLSGIYQKHFRDRKNLAIVPKEIAAMPLPDLMSLTIKAASEKGIKNLSISLGDATSAKGSNLLIIDPVSLSKDAKLLAHIKSEAASSGITLDVIAPNTFALDSQGFARRLNPSLDKAQFDAALIAAKELGAGITIPAPEPNVIRPRSGQDYSLASDYVEYFKKAEKLGLNPKIETSSFSNPSRIFASAADSLDQGRVLHHEDFIEFCKILKRETGAARISIDLANTCYVERGKLVTYKDLASKLSEAGLLGDVRQLKITTPMFTDAFTGVPSSKKATHPTIEKLTNDVLMSGDELNTLIVKIASEGGRPSILYENPAKFSTAEIEQQYGPAHLEKLIERVGLMRERITALRNENTALFKTFKGSIKDEKLISKLTEILSQGNVPKDDALHVLRTISDNSKGLKTEDLARLFYGNATVIEHYISAIEYEKAGLPGCKKQIEKGFGLYKALLADVNQLTEAQRSLIEESGMPISQLKEIHKYRGDLLKRTIDVFGKGSRKDAEALIDEVFKMLFTQHIVDSTLPYVSHDAGHSYRVARLTQQAIDSIPGCKEALESHYGPRGRILAEVSAICHDMGYCGCYKVEKGEHPFFSGDIFGEKFSGLLDKIGVSKDHVRHCSGCIICHGADKQKTARDRFNYAPGDMDLKPLFMIIRFADNADINTFNEKVPGGNRLKDWQTAPAFLDFMRDLNAVRDTNALRSLKSGYYRTLSSAPFVFTLKGQTYTLGTDDKVYSGDRVDPARIVPDPKDDLKKAAVPELIKAVYYEKIKGEPFIFYYEGSAYTLAQNGKVHQGEGTGGTLAPDQKTLAAAGNRIRRQVTDFIPLGKNNSFPHFAGCVPFDTSRPSGPMEIVPVNNANIGKLPGAREGDVAVVFHLDEKLIQRYGLDVPEPDSKYPVAAYQVWRFAAAGESITPGANKKFVFYYQIGNQAPVLVQAKKP